MANRSARPPPLDLSAHRYGSDDVRKNLLEKEEVEVGLDSPDTDLPPFPNYGRKRPVSYLIRVLHLLPWVIVVAILAWIASALFYRTREFKTEVKYLAQHGGDGGEVEVKHGDTLPKEPAAVMVQDANGDARWTVSIPPASKFPLSLHQQAEICVMAKDTADWLTVSKGGFVGMVPYDHVDGNFMEVADAEAMSLLPGTSFTHPWSTSSKIGGSSSDVLPEGTCEKSLTFAMDTTDAGLGNTLSMLWLSYGLAQKEGRAFFVDDRNWPFGKYATYFRPPPDPGCLPPPEHHKLPCPHHANHLLVSASTQQRTFGHSFSEKYEDGHGVEVMRQNYIFAMMRSGHDALFHLSSADQSHVDERLSTLYDLVGGKGGIALGIHVRHGDKHPWEYQYQKSYVPDGKYVAAARDLIDRAFGGTDGNETREAEMASKMILASDDPEVYRTSDFSHALRAQDRVILPGKAHGYTAAAHDAATEPMADGTTWEGGFTSDVFWDLGDTEKEGEEAQEAYGSNADDAPSSEEGSEGSDAVDDAEAWGPWTPPTDMGMQLREEVARSYLMDLAVVGKADRVICTVSSVGCRLLAVIMGWEKGIVQKHWHNIDGDFDWVGIRW